MKNGVVSLREGSGMSSKERGSSSPERKRRGKGRGIWRSEGDNGERVR